MATEFNEKQIENLRRKRAQYDTERKQAEQIAKQPRTQGGDPPHQNNTAHGASPPPL